MVGYLYPSEKRRLRLRPEPVAFCGLPLLGVGVPPGTRSRQLDRGMKALAARGCTRVLAHSGLECSELPERMARWGLAPVDPLPLCRAKAPELVLALVEQVPLRRRRVALRGERGEEAWSLAAALCPHVGTLLLDFHQGEEALARRLRAVYGVAALTLDQAPAPQASVELSPREDPAGRTVRLWGRPELGGLALAPKDPLPLDGPEPLALLALLWETGRLSLEEIRVCRGE